MGCRYKVYLFINNHRRLSLISILESVRIFNITLLASGLITY